MSEQTTEQLYETLKQMVDGAESQLKACQEFADKHGLLFAFEMGRDLTCFEYVPNVEFDELKSDKASGGFIYEDLSDRKEYRSYFLDDYKWLRGNWMSSSTWC